MAINSTRINYAYDMHEKLIQLAPYPIEAARAPGVADKGQVGQVWLDTTTSNLYMNAGTNNLGSIWQEISGNFVIVNLTVTGATILQGTVTMTGTPINISANAVAATVNIGTGGAAKTVALGSLNGASITTINAGAGNLNLITGGAANIVALGGASTGAFTVGNAAAGAVSFTGAAGFAVDVATTSHVTVSAAAQDLTLQSTLGAVHIVGGEAIPNAVTISASDVAGGIEIDAGTSGVSYAIVDGQFSVATGTGAVNISADAAANNINIATGNANKTLVLGSVGVGSTTTLQSAAGGLTVHAANGAMDIISGTGALSISDDAANTTVNIATGAAAKLVTVGSTNGASSLALQSGTAGITLATGATAGNIKATAATDTQASPSATAVINAQLGAATFTGFVTAAAAPQVFTITNALVTAASQILCSASNAGGNDAQMTITRINPGAGTFDVTLVNNGAAALNGDVIITFWILN